jgi:GNAT superfamily N-acetyltransferase
MDCIQIRHPNTADAARIGAIHVGSWQWAYRGLIPDDYLDSMDPVARGDSWATRLSEEGEAGHMLVAVINGSVQGFARFGASRDEDANPETGEVHAIYLDPQSVGLGVGKRLFSSCLSWLRKSGCNQATVWVLDNNSRARRFYEAAGLVLDPDAKKVDDRRGFVLSEVRYRIPL